MVGRLIACLVLVFALEGSPVTGQDRADLLRQGLGKVHRGDPAGALAVFAQLKLNDPSDPQPYFYSGLVLSQGGHLRDALAEVQEAVSRAPRRAEYLLVYAELLSRTEGIDELPRVLAGTRQEDGTPLTGVGQ